MTIQSDLEVLDPTSLDDFLTIQTILEGIEKPPEQETKRYDPIRPDQARGETNSK